VFCARFAHHTALCFVWQTRSQPSAKRPNAWWPQKLACLAGTGCVWWCFLLGGGCVYTTQRQQAHTKRATTTLRPHFLAGARVHHKKTSRRCFTHTLTPRSALPCIITTSPTTKTTNKTQAPSVAHQRAARALRGRGCGCGGGASSSSARVNRRAPPAAAGPLPAGRRRWRRWPRAGVGMGTGRRCRCDSGSHGACLGLAGTRPPRQQRPSAGVY
jgi:hypothetical protein